MTKQLIVLASRQRCGTNALRAVIHTHPDIYCFEEVLNGDAHYLKEDYSYFKFIRDNYSVEEVHPSNHQTIFNDFVHHLHGLHDRPKTLIDLKYNTMAHVGSNFISPTDWPLMAWLKARGTPIIRLRRDNYLRIALSTEVAMQRDVWHDRTENKGTPFSGKINFDLFGRMSWMNRMKFFTFEDKIVDMLLNDYHSALSLEYAELYPKVNQPITDESLEKIAEFLGVENKFTTETWCAKSTKRPLWESISNWREVCDILGETEFAHFLEDEPMYRGTVEVATKDRRKINFLTADAMLRSVS